MADAVSRAQAILRQFKGDVYAFGFDVLDQIGPFASALAGPTRFRKEGHVCWTSAI